MALFDFLFPEQAQASHLRELVRVRQLEAARDRHDKRAIAGRQLNEQNAQIEQLFSRLETLQSELDESQMVIRALVKMILSSSDYTTSDLKNLIEDIDLEDGVRDGRITPEAERPRPKFVPRRKWSEVLQGDDHHG